MSTSPISRIPRIGYGWDSHEFQSGVPLKIGGINLPHHSGLAGHSDGDVLLHALTDALLGAIAAGDIGTFFPPTDPRWKGADSAVFLQHALKRVTRAGYSIANVDSTLILAAPKISPHARKIQVHVADLLGVPASAVSVKAKTPEGMGTDNAAIAHVTVLLVSQGQDLGPRVSAAEAVPQSEIDRLVKEVLRDVPEPKRQVKIKPVKAKK